MGHSISARFLPRVKVYRLNHLIESAPCDERVSSQIQSWLSDSGDANYSPGRRDVFQVDEWRDKDSLDHICLIRVDMSRRYD